MDNIPDVPHGFCSCGCGRKTEIAERTNSRLGHRKGEPKPHIKNHSKRRKFGEYRVEDRGHDTPCWIWQLKINKGNGYGHIGIGGKTKLAHRYYYELYKGRIPTGYSLDHLCRVRSCVNPDHLEAVPIHINQRRGSRTILKEELVYALRDAHEHGVELPTLEMLTGIKRRTLRAAIHGENWSK